MVNKILFLHKYTVILAMFKPESRNKMLDSRLRGNDTRLYAVLLVSFFFGFSGCTPKVLQAPPNPKVTLSVGATNISEGPPKNSLSVTATLSELSDRYVVINLKKGGPANQRYDYRLADSIIVQPGSMSASVPLTTMDDTLHEMGEIVTVEIDTITYGSHSGSQQQTVTILDDDPVPTVSLSVENITTLETVPENSTRVTARLNTISGLDVVVNLMKSGTATERADYTLANQIVIPAGDFSASVMFSSLFDTLIEGNETVEIEINRTKNAMKAPSAMQTVKIIDVPPPIVILSLENSAISESGLSNKTKLTATLNVRSTLDVIVNLNQSGSATAGADYTLADRIVVPAGRLTASLFLTAIADQVSEASETVIVGIDTVYNGVAGKAPPYSILIYNNN
ncbi:MAG: Calx-beta domain-containing protein [Nitrospirota bacterium]